MCNLRHHAAAAMILATLAAGDPAAGRDGEIFEAEAAKVVAAWEEARTCKKAGGPNECRLIHERSCREALLEIGPEGTSLPGLVSR